ncbi:DegT/DnrJ/EryC1/StrS family aminotransferase [Aerococcus viridans]|uniref:Aminotransferase DegT n=1 Tax=Aerococcus viridans TaxID=1377 RepID=A0A2J9PNN5_9LACT|nr:DegT/DnrJ/EryC1/StrS family aminotransferase [Aerococcus viridans]PNL91953.1 aminotransferase DegT [Aerococcus viridans]
MIERILLSSPHMSEEGFEREFVNEAFDTNWIAPLGNNVNRFEEELAEMVGTSNSLALDSGTAAIHLALKAVGVGQGDKVFCQSLTFAASANPIMYQGAEPVFIDSEYETWNMDPEALEEAFQNHKPKAVIVVHLYGVAAQIDKIKKICDKYDTPLIEDAAESLGTIVNGQWTGTFGDYGIFSFNGNKIITTSGGGMLISENAEGIAKAKYWATQAREPVLHYEHKDYGYNYRLSNLSAGVGRGQLKVLEQRIQKKNDIFNRYKNAFEDIDEIIMLVDKDDERSNHWLSPMIIKTKRVTPQMIIDRLNEENIESRPIWKPMHLQPVYKGYSYYGDNVSETLFETGICLPSDTKMTIDQQNQVIKLVKELWS